MQKMVNLQRFKKADDSALFSNYRPISILPCFSKVLERLVYNRLIKYFNDNTMLYAHQYGFRVSMTLVMPWWLQLSCDC